MKKSLIIIFLYPLLVLGQNDFILDRLTIEEIEFITTCNRLGSPNKVDSVLTAKHFSPIKTEDKSIMYNNVDGDLYYVGYNKNTNVLMTLLAITEYEYFISLKSSMSSKYKKLKTDKFVNYDVADFFDGGVITFIAGTDQKKNDFAILTTTSLGSP